LKNKAGHEGKVNTACGADLSACKAR